MKGNYPNPTLPSALQYLCPPSFSTHCSHSTISGYSSYSPFDSTCTPFSSLSPCPSKCSPAFIISTFYALFFRLPFYQSMSFHFMSHHLSKHAGPAFCRLLFLSLFSFLLPLFLHLHLYSPHKGAINWTGHKGPLWMGTLMHFLFLFWGQCQLCLDFYNLSVWLKAHTGQIGPIIFPCFKRASITMLGEACSRQYVLLVKSWEANVFVMLCSDSFCDLCCMSCRAVPPPPPPPSSLLSLTAVFFLMKQKSQKLWNTPDRNCWSYSQAGSQQLIDSE